MVLTKKEILILTGLLSIFLFVLCAFLLYSNIINHLTPYEPLTNEASKSQNITKSGSDIFVKLKEGKKTDGDELDILSGTGFITGRNNTDENLVKRFYIGQINKIEIATDRTKAKISMYDEEKMDNVIFSIILKPQNTSMNSTNILCHDLSHPEYKLWVVGPFDKFNDSLINNILGVGDVVTMGIETKNDELVKQNDGSYLVKSVVLRRKYATAFINEILKQNKYE